MVRLLEAVSRAAYRLREDCAASLITAQEAIKRPSIVLGSTLFWSILRIPEVKVFVNSDTNLYSSPSRSFIALSGEEPST